MKYCSGFAAYVKLRWRKEFRFSERFAALVVQWGGRFYTPALRVECLRSTRRPYNSVRRDKRWHRVCHQDGVLTQRVRLVSSADALTIRFALRGGPTRGCRVTAL
jgi:hypothetical protein